MAGGGVAAEAAGGHHGADDTARATAAERDERSASVRERSVEFIDARSARLRDAAEMEEGDDDITGRGSVERASQAGSSG